jgi:DNA invertase Pin-like site-specific DNA recombinase
MKKIVGYIRCSCDKSDVENQRFEITNFCERNGLTIDEWVEETISGTKDYSTRKLGELLLRVDKNTRIICSEISRIGRNMYGVMDFLNHCMQRGCELWTIKDNFRLGDDLSSKVIAFAFALSAEIERSLLSQRTKQSLARLKAEGKQIGRASKITPEIRKEVIAELSNGGTVRGVAERFGLSASAVQRVKKGALV